MNKEENRTARTERIKEKIRSKKGLIKVISIVLFIVVMTAVTIVCIPLVKMLSTEEGRAGLETLVDNNLVLGVAVYLLLQIMQVVIALIPGGVIQILGGVLFGQFWGTVLCILGLLLGEIVVFSVVRKFGMPVVEAFIDGKGLRKFEFLNDSKKLEMTIFILFLIPGVPKDVLTYIAPLTKIKPGSFYILSMISRFPAAILSIVFGANLSEGNILSALVIFLIVAVIGVLGILYKDKAVELLKHKKEANHTDSQ